MNAAVIRANCPNNQRAITLVYCDIGICFMASIERFLTWQQSRMTLGSDAQL